MKDQKNLQSLPEHIFIAFWCHFTVLIVLKQALPVSHLTVTLWMMSNNRRSVSSIVFVHVRSILQELSYSPDEEIDRDITCRMIGAIFLSFLRAELYSPVASSIGKWSLITCANLQLLLVIRRVTA
jgi:hypothetical protein